MTNHNQTQQINTVNRSHIRNIVNTSGNLAVADLELKDDSDLYELGLTSLNTVNLMLAIEDHFDVEFEEEMLTRRTFQSIDSIADTIGELLAP